MSPTGTAILGNVLVSQVSEVINAVNVVPDPVVWQGNGGQDFLARDLNGFSWLSSAGLANVSVGNSDAE